MLKVKDPHTIVGIRQTPTYSNKYEFRYGYLDDALSNIQYNSRDKPKKYPEIEFFPLEKKTLKEIRKFERYLEKMKKLRTETEILFKKEEGTKKIYAEEEDNYLNFTAKAMLFYRNEIKELLINSYEDFIEEEENERKLVEYDRLRIESAADQP